MRTIMKGDLKNDVPNFAVVTVEEGLRGNFVYQDEAELFAEILSERYPLASYEVVRYQDIERIFYKEGKKYENHQHE